MKRGLMELILSSEEIIQENIRMSLENNTLVSLLNYPKTITTKKLRSYLNSDFIPNTINSKDILQNRNVNINNNEIDVLKGLTIRNSTLKYVPTDDNFYCGIVEENVATELYALEPVLILHYSLDYKWYYVQSYFYRGWLKKDDILLVNDEIFNNFINPKKFIIVIDKYITVLEQILHMGVKIPYLLEHNDYYEALIPNKDGFKITNIAKSGVNKGYLAYTADKVYQQALKYLNTTYRWGGTDNGIDCSLLIVNVFKTFGLYFPRDTAQQEKTIGINKINLKGKTSIEKKECLKFLKTPYILYKPGHVLLGINEDTVIHAYGKAQKVIISKISNAYGDNLYPYLTSAINLFKKNSLHI